MEAIFISGPSGVGKTTVSQRLVRRLADPWLFFEVDRCQPPLPDRPGLATIENDRAMVAANVGAVRSYVDAGFRVLAEMDVADDFGQATVRQLLGGRARSIVLTSSARAEARRQWDKVDVDRIEWTDSRSVEDVVEAVRSWIEERPDPI
jgi:hypothetical protein